MLEHGDLTVVDHDLLRNATKELKGMLMSRQEVLHRFSQSELDIEHPAVAEHHDKEAQPATGGTHTHRPSLSPVHLGALARSELEREESRCGCRAHVMHKGFQNAVATGVTLLFEPRQQLGAGVRMPFQHPEDRAFERIKFAGPFGHLAGPILFTL